MAFHDRRTEDLSDDVGTVGGSPADAHVDFDQRRRPQGSLFVELYNPAGPLEPPADATDTNPPFVEGTNYQSCVRLNQTTPGGQPVWRLLITEPDTGANPLDRNDPDDPTANPPTIERSVYFVNPSAAGISGDGQQYYPSASGNIAPILPGRYAVIGPASGTTTVGKTDGDATKTRRIVLTEDPNPNASWTQVQVCLNGDPSSTANELPTGATGSIKPPVAIAVDQPRRLSVSEPVNGYTETGYEPATDTYSPVLLQPLDAGHTELMQTEQPYDTASCTCSVWRTPESRTRASWAAKCRWTTIPTSPSIRSPLT